MRLRHAELLFREGRKLRGAGTPGCDERHGMIENSQTAGTLLCGAAYSYRYLAGLGFDISPEQNVADGVCSVLSINRTEWCTNGSKGRRSHIQSSSHAIWSSSSWMVASSESVLAGHSIQESVTM